MVRPQKQRPPGGDGSGPETITFKFKVKHKLDGVRTDTSSAHGPFYKERERDFVSLTVRLNFTTDSLTWQSILRQFNNITEDRGWRVPERSSGLQTCAIISKQQNHGPTQIPNAMILNWQTNQIDCSRGMIIVMAISTVSEQHAIVAIARVYCTVDNKVWFGNLSLLNTAGLSVS